MFDGFGVRGGREEKLADVGTALLAFRSRRQKALLTGLASDGGEGPDRGEREDV